MLLYLSRELHAFIRLSNDSPTSPKSVVHLSIEWLAVLVLLYSLHHLYCCHQARQGFRNFCLRHDCGEPVVDRNVLPWGLERYHKVLTFKGDLLDDWLAPRFEQLGSTFISTGIFGARLVYTIEPRNIQTILSTSVSDWEMGDMRRNVTIPLLGRAGIFTADGAEWGHMRSMLRPHFGKERYGDMQIFSQHVERLLQNLPLTTSGDVMEVDLTPLFFRLTLNTATEFLLGVSIDPQFDRVSGKIGRSEESDRNNAVLSIAGKDIMTRDSDQISAALQTAQATLALRFQAQHLYWLVDSFDFRHSCRVIHRFIDRHIARALQPDLIPTQQSPSPGVNNSSPHHSLIDTLSSQTSSRQDLRDQLIHLLIASRDTTACTLSWTFLLLARHPAVYARLRSEVLSAFGPPSASAKPGTPITLTCLKSLPFLQCIINETLRLYPALPMNNRVATRATTLPSGGGPDGTKPIAITKGEKVVWSAYVMHRRTDLWGADAASFRPERWEGRKIKGWEFGTWGGGPRICLGQGFAMAEISLVLVEFCRRWARMESIDGEAPLAKTLGLTISPGKAVKVRLLSSAF